MSGDVLLGQRVVLCPLDLFLGQWLACLELGLEHDTLQDSPRLSEVEMQQVGTRACVCVESCKRYKHRVEVHKHYLLEALLQVCI